MKLTETQQTSAMILLYVMIIPIGMFIGTVIAWLLLVLWNYFIVALGLSLVVPVTAKAAFALMLFLSALRFLLRSFRKK